VLIPRVCTIICSAARPACTADAPLGGSREAGKTSVAKG
jgi:hypothetical protein